MFLYQLSGKQNSCLSLLPPLWQVTVFDTFVTKKYARIPICDNVTLLSNNNRGDFCNPARIGVIAGKRIFI